jgi:hypothetical protein
MPLGIGSLVLDQDFKIKRISTGNRTATIEVKGSVTKGAPQGALGLGLGLLFPGQAFTVIGGELEGEYIWDYSAGRLISAETQLNLDTALDTPLGRMRLKQELSTSVRWVMDFGPYKKSLDGTDPDSLQ